MKSFRKNKLLVFVVILAIFTSSCKQNIISENSWKNEDFEDSIDCQHQYIYSGMPPQIAESKDYYYHISDDFLYSISKKDNKVRALDNNPDNLDDKESSHEMRKESNAYFSSPRLVQYVNGKLYVLASNEVVENKGTSKERVVQYDTLFEVDQSGGGRKIVFQAKKDIDGLLIHRNYIYYTTREYSDSSENNVISASDIKKFHLERVPLDKPNATAEQIYSNDNPGYIIQLVAKSNYMYFMNVLIDEENNVGTSNEMLVLNLDTKEHKPLQPISENTYLYSWPLFISEDKVAFGKTENKYTTEELIRIVRESGKEYPEIKFEIVKTDYFLNQEEQLDLDNSISAGMVYNNLNYIVIDNMYEATIAQSPRTLSIINLEGEKLNSIELSSNNSMIIGINSDYIFLQAKSAANANQEGRSSRVIYILDINKFANNEKVTWETFLVK